LRDAQVIACNHAVMDFKKYDVGPAKPSQPP